MFIQTEQTPNPATLKFLPGREVMVSGTADFTTAAAAARSPLATALFAVDGVRGVFFGGDFVTVTKDETRDWQLLKPSILSVIMEHFTAGQAIISAAAETAETALGESASGPSTSDGDGEIVAQIKELLATRVRPAVAQDGGDITFHSFEDGVVTLHLQGSCSGCPSSTATLKSGIENLLRHYIPEVREVRAAQ